MNLTEDEVKKLPTQFETVPYSTFFKLWYALQKSLPADKKGEILTKIGRTKAEVDFVKNQNGEIIKLKAKQDSCKMCYANTYYKFHDNGSPSCMFPQVMMGILSKVKNKFGFKNLRFEGVQKGGVGECAMTWNLK
ncbi:MAG: hypothetical protein ACW990_01275 [Promethearchaeota archaeon]|jgi:hypothetical protein